MAVRDVGQGFGACLPCETQPGSGRTLGDEHTVLIRLNDDSIFIFLICECRNGKVNYTVCVAVGDCLQHAAHNVQRRQIAWDL